MDENGQLSDAKADEASSFDRPSFHLRTKDQARWYAHLFLRAIDECEDVETAMNAAELAISMQPWPAEGDLSDRVKIEPFLASVDAVGNEHKGKGIVLPLSAFLSHDIFNRSAQGILNRAISAAKSLSAAARRDLVRALKLKDQSEMAREIVDFIGRYRQQIASLLSSAQIASLLEGAREVARDIPRLPSAGATVTPPPSLPLSEAGELVAELKKVERDEGEEEVHRRISELPADQQQFLRQAIRTEMGEPPPLPPADRIKHIVPSEGEPEKIRFPIIDEAVEDLEGRNVLTREEYDALDYAARSKSFTVAGVDAAETLTKIRDVIAKVTNEGVDVDEFRKQVMEAADEGTFLSDAHMENVLRTNVQTAFSDGQMKVLRHPYVRSGFPYAMYSAIHDNRVRPNHKALEKLGIDGTNIYRMDDPVFQTFRPPWDYCDRCSWVPLTVKQAAALGLREAIEWDETGVDPGPTYVEHPPFQPPAGFKRSLSGSPLSIQLSLSMSIGDVFLGGFTGVKEDSLGRKYRYVDGRRVAMGGKDGLGNNGGSVTKKTSSKSKPTVDQTVNSLSELKKSGGRSSVKVVEMLRGHTVAELKQIQEKLGISIKGNKVKEERAREIATQALAKIKSKKDIPRKESKESEEREETPVKIDRSAPIAERLKKAGKHLAYRLKSLASIPSYGDTQREIVAQAEAQITTIRNQLKKVKDPKKKRELAKEQQEVIYAKYRGLRELDVNHKQQMRAKVLDAIRVKDPVKIGFVFATDIADKETLEIFKDSHAKAADFINQIVAKGENGEVMPQLRAVARVGRAHFDLDNSVICDPNDAPRVHAHEIAHAIEHNMPGAHEACLEFLRYRVKDEQPKKMAEIFPTLGYKDDEIVRKDDFDKSFNQQDAYYVGKDYGDRATEILSMGVERLYTDPASFAKQDPEYCSFVLGILDGSLRGISKKGDGADDLINLNDSEG